MSPRVLIAEDEVMVALPLSEVFQDAGYVAEMAFTGQQAMMILERGAKNIGVLVTDIRIPGPTGWEVAQRARRIHPAIQVLYLSADSGIDHATLGVPGSRFLQKPFTNEAVVQAVAELTRK